jgi:hypothetical protein
VAQVPISASNGSSMGSRSVMSLGPLHHAQLIARRAAAIAGSSSLTTRSYSPDTTTRHSTSENQPGDMTHRNSPLTPEVQTAVSWRRHETVETRCACKRHANARLLKPHKIRRNDSCDPPWLRGFPPLFASRRRRASGRQVAVGSGTSDSAISGRNHGRLT